MAGYHTRLFETWYMQWRLLDMAVRLDRQWVPSLQQQGDDATQEVVSIAQKLAGFERDFGSLGELREHLLERIIETGSTLADSILADDLSDHASGTGRGERCAEDILFIARTLDRCVGMRSCRLTFNFGAQQALWSSISAVRDSSEQPLLGPELVQHTCIHVLSRLENWVAH